MLTHEDVWEALEQAGIFQLDFTNQLDAYRAVKAKGGDNYTGHFWYEVDQNGLGMLVRLDTAGRVLEQEAARTGKQFSRLNAYEHLLAYAQKRGRKGRPGRPYDPGSPKYAFLPAQEVAQKLDGQDYDALRRPRHERNVKLQYLDHSGICAVLLRSAANPCAPKRQPPLSACEFLHKPFTQKGAISAFEDWICGRAPIRTDILSAYRRIGSPDEDWDFHSQTDDRTELLDDLSSWLSKTGKSTRMLWNIHAPTSWSGLSALANHILRQDWKAGGKLLRPLCVPVILEGHRRAQFSHSQILSLLLSFTREEPHPGIVPPLPP